MQCVPLAMIRTMLVPGFCFCQLDFVAGIIKENMTVFLDVAFYIFLMWPVVKQQATTHLAVWSFGENKGVYLVCFESR
jgi:hypothetical protein